MNILTDILSLIKRKKFVKEAKPNDVIVLGINEEPEIEGIASPVPYKDVKLIKVEDFISGSKCEHRNVPIADTVNPGVFKDETIDPTTGECYVNLRKFKSLSLDLTINENGDYIEFDLFSDTGIVSIPNAQGQDIYYSSLNDALTAAVPGETVYLHTNILETTDQVVLKDGVNIHFNGFTYTYTAPGTESAFIDNGIEAKCRLINGIIIRKGSTLAGTEINTACLLTTNASSTIDSKNVHYINENGWAVSIDCKAEGLIATGSVGGIAINENVDLYDSIGKGSEFGILVFGLPKGGLMSNCKGYSLNSSSNGAGISANSIYIIDCVGQSYNDGYGIIISGCDAISLTGFSSGSWGVYVVGGKSASITGYTEASGAGVGYPWAGVLLYQPVRATDINGYSEGSDNAYGLAIALEGNVKSFVANSSGHHTSTNGRGGYIALNNNATALPNSLTIQSCSFAGKSRACVIQNSDTHNLVITNSSFVTDDAGIGLFANTDIPVKYANCSFNTGQNSLGTPYSNITQDIVNTSDNYGNIYT
jgi:hypothetical protein